RSRTDRLHAFASADQVESILASLAERVGRPLTRQLDRGAGQREARWIQLLQADPDGRAEAAAHSSGSSGGGPSRSPGRVDELEGRVAALEARLAQLVTALDGLVELPDP